MHIIQISSECAPVAKVGGLADVVFGLSRELIQAGHQVEVILPKYDSMRYDHISELKLFQKDLWVPWFEGTIHCSVYSGIIHGIRAYFVDAHSDDFFFNRGYLYGAEDDAMRFAFFSRAALDFIFQAGIRPDILHCHDWQTGLIPVLLFDIYQGLGLDKERVCYTIHNFAHQGVISGDVLRATQLYNPEQYYSADRLIDDGRPDMLNMMRGGIIYSNFITTVSPKHAFEVRMTDQGCGLQHLLGIHHRKFGGVLNGIDYSAWNPASDTLIPYPYSIDSLQEKYENKKALRHRLFLREDYSPIISYIGRLDGQKGVHLIKEAIHYASWRGAQFVLLGSSPDPHIAAEFEQLKNEYNDHPDIHLELAFDAELAHLIYAGSDMMIVPSNYEPCGLTQMISMRYGTVPIVRSVGGLADTVFDREFSDVDFDKRNGFVFEHADKDAIIWALSRAVGLWYDYPEEFQTLIKNGMRSDHSWYQPAKHYQNIYRHIKA